MAKEEVPRPMTKEEAEILVASVCLGACVPALEEAARKLARTPDIKSQIYGAFVLALVMRITTLIPDYVRRPPVPDPVPGDHSNWRLSVPGSPQ